MGGLPNNTRLKISEIKSNELLALADRLYDHLKYKELLNSELMKHLLSKRFVWLILLKKDVKLIKNKWLWLGIKNILEDKLLSSLFKDK